MPPSTSITSYSPRLAEWARWLGWLAALGIVAWSPFSGGPRVPSAVLGLLGLWLLLREPRSLLAHAPAQRWLAVFALLWVPALLSLAGSVHAESTRKVVAVLPLYALAGLGLLAVLADRRRRTLLHATLAGVLVFWIADSYLQFLVGVDVIGRPLSDDGRVVGLFDGNLRQAVLLASLSPLLLWWLAGHRIWLTLLAYPALLGVVVLSGVRGAWVITLLVGVVFLWHQRRRLHWAWVVAGLAVVVVLMAQSDLVERKLAQTAAVDELSFEQLDRVLGHRLVIWETAAAMLADRPLTGIGAGAFDEAYTRYASREQDPFRPDGDAYVIPVYHAHHMWVSAAAERGLPGLLGLLVACVLCVRWYVAADEPARRAARPAAVGLTAVAFPVNSQPILFTNWWLPVMMLLLGLFLSALQENAEEAP